MVRLSWTNKKDLDVNKLKDNSINFERVKLIRPINSSGEMINVWSNKLFWGDNKHVIFYLLSKFTDKINLIYIDPPFATGSNYILKIRLDGNIIKEFGYKDNWGKNIDSYLQMMYERLILMKELLASNGLIIIHLDWHVSHYIRAILDEIFGKERFVNEIIWYYYNKYSAGKNNLPRAHDNILIYSKGRSYTFNELRLKRDKPIKQLMRESVNGVLKNVKDENGHVKYRIVHDKKADDVWKIPCIQPASSEWTGYPTQKHPMLLERLIQIGSNEGDLIADFFCGSGTTLQVAQRLNRKWIGCDISKYAISIAIQKFLKQRVRNTRNIDFYPIQLLAVKNEKTLKAIKSGFFNKTIEILRGK